MRLAPVSLTTSRLLLRPHAERDLASWIEALSDREVARRLRQVPHPYTELDARSWMTQVAQGRAIGSLQDFAIARLDNEQLIGGIGFAVGDSGVDASLGYWIARPLWGLGYAREALRRVVAYAFDELAPPLDRLEAHVHRENPSSLRVLDACGFTDCGWEKIPACGLDGITVAHRYELHRGARKVG